MSCPNLTILHLSDLHAEISKRDDLRRRLKSLFSHIESHGLNNISAVVFSGDIAYSGQKDEYDLAGELFFGQLIKRLHVNKRKIFLVPGNHDVDRTSIDKYRESGIREELIATDKAELYLDNNGKIKRLTNYHAFLSSYFDLPDELYVSRALDIDGINLGISCLNSAWRCFGDDDKGKLFLTEKQINSAVEQLGDSIIKIAVVHHPLDYYHISESNVALIDLRREFNLILHGHIHKNYTLGEKAPDYNCITFATHAIFSDPHEIGYNIYEICLKDQSIKANYFQYIRRRDDFDKDVQHAPNGEIKFDLPPKSNTDITTILTCHEIKIARDRLEEEIKSHLALYQERKNPIFVRPMLKSVVWQNKTKVSEDYTESLADIADNDCVVYGEEQSGKSILMKKIASDFNFRAIQKPSNEISLYLDINYVEMTFSEIQARIQKELKNLDLPSSPDQLILCLDNYFLTELTDGRVQTIKELKANGYRIILSLPNKLLFDKIISKVNGFDGYNFIEISYWGPSRIRKFVIKFCEQYKSIDVAAAYQFIISSLQNSDLPSSPVVICLYLYAFLVQGQKLTSLSFLQLLEFIEMHRLTNAISSKNRDLYHYKEVLILLAIQLYDQYRKENRLSIQLSKYIAAIEAYFETKDLKADANSIIEDLRRSGLITIDDTGKIVTFRYIVFFDYYLARACYNNRIRIDEIIDDIFMVIKCSDAIALYCGINREFSKAAMQLINHMRAHFNAPQNITLNDLDKYIKNLLLENDEETHIDDLANGAVSTEIDYHEHDREYEERKKTYDELRNYKYYLNKPTCSVEDLTLKIFTLKSFYNIFRNLEGITSEEKLQYLDEVLNYHIDCNMELIKYISTITDDTDITTAMSYLVSIFGQQFLYSNIANQNLEITLQKSIENSTNDFKKLLLVCLYADLKLPDYIQLIIEFIPEIHSIGAIELLYLQIYNCIVTRHGSNTPKKLVDAFKLAIQKRRELAGFKTKKGVLAEICTKLLKKAEMERKKRQSQDEKDQK